MRGDARTTRSREQGYLGLVEQSRRPVSSPLATGEEIVVSILELKERRPSWGPQKISQVLARKLGASAPGRSTVARVLSRLGKVKRQRSPVRARLSSALAGCAESASSSVASEIREELGLPREASRKQRASQRRPIST